jgi:hypothetical protein
LILIPLIIVIFIVLLWRTYCRRKTEGVYKQIAIPDGNIFVIDDEENDLTHSIVIDAHQHHFSRSSSRTQQQTTNNPSRPHTATTARNWFSDISEIFYPTSSRGRVVEEEDEEASVIDSWHYQQTEQEIDSLPVKTIIPSSTSKASSLRLQHLDHENRSTINIIPKSIPSMKSSSSEGSPHHSPRGKGGGGGGGGGGGDDDDDEEEENRKLSQINRNMLMRSNSKLSVTGPSSLSRTDDPDDDDSAPGEGEEEKGKSKRVMSRQSSSSSMPQLRSLGSPAKQSSSSSGGIFSSLWSIFQGKREAVVSLQEMSTRPKNSPPSSEPIHLGVNLQDDDDEEGIDSFANEFISPNMNDSPVKLPQKLSLPLPSPPPLSPPPEARGSPQDLKDFPSSSSPRHDMSPLSSPMSSPRKTVESPNEDSLQRKMTPSPTLSRRASSESFGSGEHTPGVWATMSEKMKAEKRVKILTSPKTSPGDDDFFHPTNPGTSDWFDNEVVFSHHESSPQRVQQQADTEGEKVEEVRGDVGEGEEFGVKVTEEVEEEEERKPSRG